MNRPTLMYVTMLNKNRAEDYRSLYQSDVAIGLGDELKYVNPITFKILKNRNGPPGRTFTLTLGDIKAANYDRAMKILENK
jgi:hypothetical protein